MERGLSGRKGGPSGAKDAFFQALSGTAKAVPFPNRAFPKTCLFMKAVQL